MTDLVNTSGYQRDTDQRPNHLAVRWWYVRTDPDGSVFARGGRTATSREARSEINSAQYQHARDREVAVLNGRRPEFLLQRDGALKVAPR